MNVNIRGMNGTFTGYMVLHMQQKSLFTQQSLQAYMHTIVSTNEKQI